MDTKEKSLDFDFIHFVNEERSDILSHSLNSTLELETIAGAETIGNLPWGNIKDDISVDLQLSDFRLIDLMPLTKTSNSCTKISVCNYTKYNSEVLKYKPYFKGDPSLGFNISDDTVINSKFEESSSYNKLNIPGSKSELDQFCKRYVQQKYVEVCKLCNQKFSSLGRKRFHMLKLHKMKLYISCALCKASFFLRKDLIKHISEIHQSETGKYSCIKCNTSYGDYKTISLHLKNHSLLEKPSFSKSNIDRSDIIEKPKERIRSIQEKKFACDKCGKRFAFSCLLKDHINLHTGIKPYLCRICGKSFSQKSSIKQHHRTHNPVRPHKCPECPQGFFGKGDLKKHIRLHTGERPYICEICGESFSQSSHLIVHRRTHTGERPYKCDICFRGFTKNSDVLRHRRIHTGEMPYICKHCGKSFRQSTPFKNHVKTHHPADTVMDKISGNT